MRRMLLPAIVMALFAAGASVAYANGKPGHHDHHGQPQTATYCVGNQTVNVSDNLRQYQDAAAGGELYTLPSGRPFWDQSPSQHEIDRYGLSSTSIAAGGCANGTSKVMVVPQTNSSFLCYSTSQTDPAVFNVTAVPGMVVDGYWQPWAVNGNTTPGTNVGGYHLVCNLTAGQAETGTYVDNDGVVYAANPGAPGIYPLAG